MLSAAAWKGTECEGWGQREGTQPHDASMTSLASVVNGGEKKEKKKGGDEVCSRGQNQRREPVERACGMTGHCAASLHPRPFVLIHGTALALPLSSPCPPLCCFVWGFPLFFSSLYFYG